MSLSVYYHAYCDGDWREPVDDFLQALDDDTIKLNVGAVGSCKNRTYALDYICRQMPQLHVVAEAEKGWEQLTLTALYKQLRHMGGLVLYAHTKGASDPIPFNTAWRRSMTNLVVRDRKKCCSEIYLRGVDAVGCHWLTVEGWQGLITTPIFGGNFWIARTSYLRKLPRPQTKTRYQAEEWIGLGSPTVLDLLPGFPNESLFARATA